MNHLLILLIAFGIDLVLGDPHSIPHPVQGIGKVISFLEPILRKAFPKTEKGEKSAGVALVVLVIGWCVLFTALVFAILGRIWAPLRTLAEIILCYQMLATKSLRDESMKVAKALQTGTIEDGRNAVGMIVGRDTDCLSEEEVIAAAVETVAENASDAILAPLMWMALLGPLGGMFYKAANTMDSMVGYKNDQYLNFGCAAARFDDVVNFIPARVSGFLMCVAAYFGYDGPGAFRIFFRDRLNHKSPNSAHTEAACAGALGLLLGGTHLYFGKPVEKPTIGDPVRPIEIHDIADANNLSLMTAILALILFDVIPLVLIWL